MGMENARHIHSCFVVHTATRFHRLVENMQLVQPQSSDVENATLHVYGI